MATDNAALVRRLFDEVWTKGKLEVIDELASPSHVDHDPIAGELKGTDAMKALVQGYRSAFPDLRFIIDDLAVAGDKVVVRWSATGTHKGALFGVAPTGKSCLTGGIGIIRIQNGKTVESWTQWDALGLLQQIGAMPQIGKARPVQPEARPH